MEMTYGRSRLWLGIVGVGSFVAFTGASVVVGAPYWFLPSNNTWTLNDLVSLLMFILLFAAVMLPFDLIGGFLLPRGFHRQRITAGDFFRRWIFGVSLQAAVFLVAGMLILAAGRVGGRLASTLVVLVGAFTLVACQRRFARWMARVSLPGTDTDMTTSMDRAKHLGCQALPAMVVENSDPGFTGGVVGLPCCESLVVSRMWIDQLTSDQLSAAIARRLEAVASGSRNRGILVALAWNGLGFLVASYLPGAGVTSVAELVTTCLGFTGWTFIGLLVLPTVSRQATYAIDRQIIDRGVSRKILMTMLEKLDHLQDGEPSRPALIETIFHPVPSLENRGLSFNESRPVAWHAARMMLFLSWSCLGLLSRAVHCNVGRPELWIMLPTD